MGLAEEANKGGYMRYTRFYLGCILLAQIVLCPSALAGAPLSPSVTGGVLSPSASMNVTVRQLTETYVAIGTQLTGVVSIDMAKGTLFSGTITGDTTFTVANPPAVGFVGNFTLELVNGGSQNVTWTDCTWEGGTAPTLTVSGIDVITGYTRDGGTTYRCFLSALDIK